MTQSSSNTNGTSSTNQTQQQQSTTNPWAPSQQELIQLLRGVQGVSPGVTGAQSAAAGNLVNASNGLPNFGGQAAGVTSGLLGGDPTGLLNSSLQSYQQNVNPIATQSLDPTQNPAVQNALQAAAYNATQANNAVFAGSGRTGGGAQSYALGQGMANAEAPLLLGQYNQNVQNVLGANQGLLGAGQGTANAITGNQQAGLGAAALQPGIQTAPALAQLQAAQTQYNLPLSNLGAISGLTLPIAGLGGQSTGSGTASGTGVNSSQTTIDPSMLASILQGTGILGGNLGLFGTAGQGGTNAIQNAGNMFSSGILKPLGL